MRLQGHIFILFVALFLCSCITDSLETVESVYAEGIIKLEVKEETGEADDRMETIRFIVFKDISVSPKVEVNELKDVKSLTTEGKGTSKIESLLRVSRRTSGTNEKMVVVIVNEPAALKEKLDGITSYSDLQNLELVFSDFLNIQHTALQDTKALPMTGMVQTDKVYPTEEEADADREELTLYRAVARIEIYIRKDAGSTIDFGTGSTIELINTYGKEYLLCHKIPTGIFGQIQTVTSGFVTKAWTQTTTVPITEDEKGRFICSFYTPERTCMAENNADKLSVAITIESSGGETRSGEIVLDKARLDGVEKEIDAILRNNTYRILATVENNASILYVNVEILPWVIENVDIEFN